MALQRVFRGSRMATCVSFRCIFVGIDSCFRESTAYSHVLRSYFVPYHKQLVMMHYEFALFPFSIINIQSNLLLY